MSEIKVHCKYDELVDPETLKHHPKNRNSHPQDQIERLARIIEYQGWRYAVKVSLASGFVTSGHGRIMAAGLLGVKIPVVYQEYISEEQEYADVQADNAIAAWSELDLSGINTDIGDLGPDFDLDLLGLKDFKIDPSELPDLPTGDRSELRQMAFQVTEFQQQQIERALKLSKTMGDFDESESSNSNGNALQRMAEVFCTQNGSS